MFHFYPFQLKEAGYTDIDYHDVNDGMKAEALKKDVYHGKFYNAYLGHDKFKCDDSKFIPNWDMGMFKCLYKEKSVTYFDKVKVVCHSSYPKI